MAISWESWPIGTWGGERQARIPFLGQLARFPEGPFRLAAILKRPVVFMTGLYRGGRRYDIQFDLIFEPDDADGRAPELRIEEMMRHYVTTLEVQCRSAPYNWFNFYDFWA